MSKMGKAMKYFVLPGAIVLGLGGAFKAATAEGPRDPMGPCPNTPNCVSSLTTDTDKKVAPFDFNGNPKDAKNKLVNIIANMERTKIIVNKGGYLHAEFKTAIGFTDDIEFQFDLNASKIDVRSASRFGYSDFGANRKRVELIRQKFEGNTP